MINLEKLKQAREAAPKDRRISTDREAQAHIYITESAPDLADAVIELAEALALVIDFDEQASTTEVASEHLLEAAKAARAALAKHIKGERT